MKLKDLLERIEGLKKDYNEQGEYYDQDYDEVVKIFPLSEDSKIRILPHTHTHNFNRFEVYFDDENNELIFCPCNTRKVVSGHNKLFDQQ